MAQNLIKIRSVLDSKPIDTRYTDQDEQIAQQEADEARQKSSIKERKYRSAVSAGNEVFMALMQRTKILYQRLEQQQLSRGQLLHSLADNIVVHQTNQ